jgi:hypothetical protein
MPTAGDRNAERHQIGQGPAPLESVILPGPHLQVIRHARATNPPIRIPKAPNPKETQLILIDLPKAKRQIIAIIPDKKQPLHALILR